MCCCFPPKCLKFFIFIACILLLGVGAVLIWGGYQLLILSFLKSLGYSFVGYIIIACGGTLILVAFLGFFGAWKNKKLLLGIFIFFTFLIGLLLIAIGAALIYARQMSNDYLSSESECKDNYESAEKAYIKAEEIMCRLYCPCKADNAYITLLADEAGNDTDSKFYVNKDEGAETILDCDPCSEIEKLTDEDTYNDLVQWIEDNLGIKVTKTTCDVSTSEFEDKYFTSSMRTYLPLLEWAEEEFKCSGLCEKRSVYLFSDVDNGEPEGSCREELNDWVQENFQIMAIVGIIFGSYMIIIVFFSCTVCCCQKKKEGAEVSDPNQPRKRS